MPHPTNLHRKHFILFVLSFLSLQVFSQPNIAAFTPTSASVGSTITISGSNFDPSPANNIVFFGAVRANVTGASAGSLTVTVPAGAGFQPISVTVNRLTGWSAQSFITTFAGGTSQFTPQSFEYTAHIDSVDSNIETTRYAIGDIDNDGKPDVITIDRLNNTVSVYRNISAGGIISFAAKTDFTTGQSPRSVNFADIDGDGKQDIIVTNFGANTVSVFKNTSIGTTISFAPKIDFATATQPATIAIADLDKDGRPDLVINTVNLEGYVSVLRNTSTGGTVSFATKIDLQATGGSIEDIKAADIDGDGKTDIVIPNYSQNLVTIFRNLSTTGNLAFASPFSTMAFQDPFQIELGDLNADAKPDMIIGHYVNTNSPVFRNTSTPGNIVFQYMNSYSGGKTPTGLVLNDLDGDGKPDLAMTNGLESFSLFKNTSDPGGQVLFSAGVSIPALYNSDVRSADFDGDGRPDLAFNTGMFRVSIWKNRSASPQIYSFTPASGKTGDSITIHGANFSGIGAVSFGGVPAASFSVSDPTTIVAVIGSGSSGEILIKSATDSARISGFKFLGPPTISSFSPSFGGTGDTITITGLNLEEVDTVRFGGTMAASFIISTPGLIKAVVGAGSTGNVSVENPYGTDTLPGFTYYPPPTISSFTPVAGPAGTALTITGTGFSAVSAVTIGGLPVVSFNLISSTTISAVINGGITGRIRVTTPGGLAVSSGIFSFPKPGIISLIPASGVPGSLVTIQGTNFISDTAANLVFFGAVRAQVLAASSNSLTVSVPAGGTYQPVSVTLNGYTVYSNQPFIQTFQDWNAVLSSSSFNVKSAYGANEDPRDDYLADIDGDGLSDIVTMSDVTQTLGVLRNTSSEGHPSFAPSMTVTGGFGTSAHISIADINSDGRPDIAIVGLGGRIIVMKNTSTPGNPSFERIMFDIPEDPTYVTLQDFDGDGKVDLAFCSNNYLGTMGAITIYTNSGTEGDIIFGHSFTTDIGGSPIEIQAADFDYDGRPDIALKNGDSITIVRNLSNAGNFVFAPQKGFNAFHSTTYFYYCIADFDGDGKPDIGTSAEGYFHFIRNTTANNIISFDPKISVAVNNVTEKIIAGQLDGDGKPDVIIVGDKQLFAFHNESTPGSISFGAPIVIAPPHPYSWTDCAAIGDLDGDGKTDIAVAHGATKKISIFRNELGEIADSVCENSLTSVSSNIVGSSYQWQVNKGNGYVDIGNDSTYQDVTTDSLRIGVALSFDGYQYRCVVDGNASSTTNLVVSPGALPHGTAELPASICTDSLVDIVFTGAGDVPVNSTLELWESINNSSFTMISTFDYDGNPVTTPVTFASPSVRKYFFRIIPPAATLCGLPNNSDTASITVNQLVQPVITAQENKITIGNPNANAVYTWQMLDSAADWKDVIPAAHGISYTADSSGTFRVVGVLGACTQYSDQQKITIDPVPTGAPRPGVYPNPARGQITVEHPASSATSNIRLIDMMGRVIIDVPVVKNTTKTVVNVERVSPGIFKLVWNDGTDSFTKTVLISR